MKNRGIYILIGLLVVGILVGIYFYMRRQSGPRGLGGTDPSAYYQLNDREHTMIFGNQMDPADYEPYDESALDWSLIAHEMKAVMRPYAEKYDILPSKNSQDFYDKYHEKLLSYYRGINIQPTGTAIMQKGIRNGAKRFLAEGPTVVPQNVEPGSFVDPEYKLEILVERERWECPEGYWYDVTTQSCWDATVGYTDGNEVFSVEPIGEIMVDVEEVTDPAPPSGGTIQPPVPKQSFVGQLANLG